MRYVYAVFMLVDAVLAFYYSTRIFYNKNYKKASYRGFSAVALGSALWGLGYGVMFLTEDEDLFLIARGVGILGLFTFLLFAQYMLGFIGEFSRKLFRYFHVEVLCGAAVFYIVVVPKSVTMTHTPNGITTAFVENWVSLLYTGFTLLVASVFVTMSIRMVTKRKKKSIIAVGKMFLMMEGLIFLGMIVDTLLPAAGINLNIPASTILQFFALLIVYHSVHNYDRNQINLQNMAGYMYKSLKSPVLVFDSEHRTYIINNEARRLFDLEDVREGDMTDFWENIFGAEPPKAIGDTKDTIVVEHTYAEKEMECRLYVDSIFNDYDDYIGYIVMVNDISLNVKAMKQLELAKDAAVKASQTKSQFLANMSHEIRTPMNSILGFSQLALTDNIDDVARGYFTNIQSSAKILLSTISDILDISKIESGKMELICENYYPGEMFKDIAVIIGMQAKYKGLHFDMEIDSEFPEELYGDAGKIRQVLLNLSNNAVKYTSKGEVFINAKVLYKSTRIVGLRFEVRDTGIGITEDDLETIFDTFSRVDTKANTMTEGAGLGLSISKGFIELMDGQVFVKSTYGKGSTFTVDFEQRIVDPSPLQLPEDFLLLPELPSEKKESEIKAEREQKDQKVNTEKKNEAKDEKSDSTTQMRTVKKTTNSQKPEAQKELRKLRILAVDDNKVNLQVIRIALGRYGMDYVTASSGAEAVELCKTENFNLIFMDQMMPGMDGVEAMKQIRQLGRGYEKGGYRKIVVLTANVMDNARQELLESGFDGFLGKPIDFTAFEKTLVNCPEEPDTLEERMEEMVIPAAVDEKPATQEKSLTEPPKTWNKTNVQLHQEHSLRSESLEPLKETDDSGEKKEEEPEHKVKPMLPKDFWDTRR